MQISSSFSTNLIEQVNRSQQSYRAKLLQISTGKKINAASDGPALMAMLSRLDAEIRSSAQASRNIGDAMNLGAVADAGAAGVTENVQRIRELSVQAGNDTLTTSDRESIQAEINQLRDGINQIASSTNFNQSNLLDGSFTNKNFQVGTGSTDSVNVSIGSLSSAALGLDSIDVSSTANALAGVDSASSALDTTLSVRSQIGSFQNNMETRASNLTSSYIQKSATRSTWQDTDFAQASTDLRMTLLRSATSMAALAHYNASENSILKLFG
jgi:flagellin